MTALTGAGHASIGISFSSFANAEKAVASMNIVIRKRGSFIPHSLAPRPCRATLASLSALLRRALNVNVAQLLEIHLHRRVGHQILPAVVLWKSNHFPNALRAGDEHHQAIKTYRKSAM